MWCGEPRVSVATNSDTAAGCGIAPTVQRPSTRRAVGTSSASASSGPTGCTSSTCVDVAICPEAVGSGGIGMSSSCSGGASTLRPRARAQKRGIRLCRMREIPRIPTDQAVG
jgi:hypothetical protein